MGLSHSPSIVTSGLLLCVDAANTRSYPGSGSSWNDISGNNRNFTLINSSYYSYDTTSKSILLTRTLSPDVEIGGYAEHSASGALSAATFLYNNHTVEIWAKINDRNPTNYGGDGSESENALLVYRGFHAMFYYSSTRLVYLIWNGSSSGVSSPTLSIGTSGTDIIQGQWFNVTLVRNGNNFSMFINGTLKGTNAFSAPSNVGIGTSNNLRIGTGNNSDLPYSWHVNANISIVRMYNRELSQAEVAQNFSAIRGRFGV